MEMLQVYNVVAIVRMPMFGSFYAVVEMDVHVLIGRRGQDPKKSAAIGPPVYIYIYTSSTHINVSILF